MKKLLIIALLMLALVITAVACNDDPVETPTEAPTDEPSTPAPETEPETPAPETEPPVDPADPVLMLDAEALNTLAGAAAPNVNQLGSTEIVTEGNNTFVRWTAAGGDPYVAIIPLGSNYTLPQYMAIRYRTNSAVEGQFFLGSGAGWNGQGDCFNVAWNEGDWNFQIIDLAATGVTSITDGKLTYCRLDFFTDQGDEGNYFDVEYIGFFNTAEYAQAYDFEQHKAPMWDADKAVIKHQSFDALYFDENDRNAIFAEGGSANWDYVANFSDFSVDTLYYWGWVAYMGDLGQFGYQINGGAAIYDDAWAWETGADIVGAAQGVGADGGNRMKIAISLAGLDGTNNIRVLYKTADGVEVCLNEFTVNLPANVSETFVSDVTSNMDGTDLQASDLSNYFTITYGDADPHVVSGGMYQYGGINELYTAVDGLYAFSINMREAANTAMAFVRGTRVVHSVDLPEVDAAAGLYPINNYYETDGQGRMGGAGIYAALYNGRLNLMIKAYDDETRTHQINKDYSVVADGTELTIADNGSTVYFLVDGNLLATVALSGSTTYEKICDIAEGVTFAQTAVVTLADGTTETIENTLVVSTVNSQLGIALRPATMKFDSVKVLGFTDVEIPSEFFVPEVKENIALNKPASADSVENEKNIPSNATDGDDTTRWGALPNGAANLIIDLEEVKALVGMDVLFENAGWNYEIAISEDGEAYTVIHSSEAHTGKMVKLEGEVNARYIKFSRLDDSADTSAAHWFSIYEVLVYAKAEETDEPDEPVVPDEPDVPAVENLVIPQDQWVITGHNTKLNDTTNPMVAAGGVESAALLHQGSIALGEVDLSKYSKVVVMWGCDNSDVTINHYNANANNRIMLLNAVMDGVMSPAEETIIAGGTYELKGWKVTAFEIDLTGIDYNGPVWLAIDALPDTFALIASVEFVA